MKFYLECYNAGIYSWDDLLKMDYSSLTLSERIMLFNDLDKKRYTEKTVGRELIEQIMVKINNTQEGIS